MISHSDDTPPDLVAGSFAQAVIDIDIITEVSHLVRAYQGGESYIPSLSLRAKCHPKRSVSLHLFVPHLRPEYYSFFQ